MKQEKKSRQGSAWEWVDYLEPFPEDLLEAQRFLDLEKEKPDGEKEKITGRYRISAKRWVVLLAACMLVAGLAIGAFAADKGELSQIGSWFHVTDQSQWELLGQMRLETGQAAEDAGYRIGVEEAVSDGQNFCVLLTVTAPEGVVLKDSRYTLRERTELIKKQDKEGNVLLSDALAGGGYMEMTGYPADNQVSFMMFYRYEEMKKPFGSGSLEGKKILLTVDRISMEEGIEEKLLAEGEWKIILEVPKNCTKSVRQWTRAELEGERYYITSVSLSPLGISVKGMKAFSIGQLLEGVEYGIKKAFGMNAAVPEGWGKDAFGRAELTVQKKDGTEPEILSGGNGGQLFFCEKTVQWSRIVDTEDVEAVYLGDTPLKIR